MVPLYYFTYDTFILKSHQHQFMLMIFLYYFTWKIQKIRNSYSLVTKEKIVKENGDFHLCKIISRT